MDKLIPLFPGILAPTLGEYYSASLVRRGRSKIDSQPCIQVQSPSVPSSVIKREIRENIVSICESSGHQSLSIMFSKGHMTLLTDSQSDEDSEGEEQDFPHQKRYWKTPGMGASIGLQCTRYVSATLGGYILIDDRMYLLTVDHFIEESQTKVDESKDNSSGPLTITSPSLSHIDDMRESLEQSLRDFKVEAARAIRPLGDRDITLLEMQAYRSSSKEVQEVDDGYDRILMLLGELDRADEEFHLGSIAHRSGSNRSSPRPRSTYPSVFGQTVAAIRRDWAICTVLDYRMGDNRHRTRFMSDPAIINNQSERDNPLGDGEPCRETCDLKPNRKVRYLGSKSGCRTGEVNAAPVLVSVHDSVTLEWSIVGEEFLCKTMVEGDSGAWVIDSHTNKLVGLLYGLNDGQLLLTPIRDVFADIQVTVPATMVCLPPSQPRPKPSHVIISGSNAPNTDLIYEKTLSRKVKPYKSNTLPALASKSGKGTQSRKVKPYKFKTLPALASKSGTGSIASEFNHLAKLITPIELIRPAEPICEVKSKEPRKVKPYKLSTLPAKQCSLNSEADSRLTSIKADNLGTETDSMAGIISSSTLSDMQSDPLSLTSSASSSPKQRFSSPFVFSSSQPNLSTESSDTKPDFPSQLDEAVVAIRCDSGDDDISRRGLRYSQTFPRLEFNRDIYEGRTDSSFKLSLECILHDFPQDHKSIKHAKPRAMELKKSNTFPKSSLPDLTYHGQPIIAI